MPCDGFAAVNYTYGASDDFPRQGETANKLIAAQN